jgi:hypothetical protein
MEIENYRKVIKWNHSAPIKKTKDLKKHGN